MARVRIDVWASLQPKLQEQANRTGLSVNEIVNAMLADYFGLLPKKPN